MKLSPNFTLAEFVQSQTAARDEIDNSLPDNLLPNAIRTATGLEEVRAIALNSNQVLISSAYRCEALEKSMCWGSFLTWCRLRNLAPNDANWAKYFATKDHPKAQAADILCPTFGPPVRVMAAIAKSGITYDQLILEFPGSKSGGWVHVSFRDEPRKQALVVDSDGTRNYVA
jgi:zinc D-Ala-D-Ala carboxypeptidase